MKNIHPNDELKDIAPFLHQNQSKPDGFNTPDGYFPGLEDRIFERIEKSEIRKPTPIKAGKAPRFSVRSRVVWLAVAAAFTLILGAWWFFQPQAPTEQPVVSVELSEEEIESYLLKNLDELEDAQLAMLPAEEEVIPVKESTPKQNLSTDSEEILPEDVEKILNDMTEEELEEIL